jgi:hypothetical protein
MCSLLLLVGESDHTEDPTSHVHQLRCVDGCGTYRPIWSCARTLDVGCGRASGANLGLMRQNAFDWLDGLFGVPPAARGTAAEPADRQQQRRDPGAALTF